MTWRQTDIWQEPHVVYRIYDAADSLLYVGVSADFEARFRDHKNRAVWADDYSRHELTWYPDRWKAESAETAAIMTEQPAYNVAQVPPPRREKPVRFTLDLDYEDHRFLREFVGTAGAGGSAAVIMRTLLGELRDDPDLQARIRARIWDSKARTGGAAQ